MKLFTVGILSILMMLSGCLATPQWRVGQATVPIPIVKTEKQVEAERQAADLLARKIQEPAELKPVAVGLSASLGEPKVPLKDTPQAPDKAVEALKQGLLLQQEQLAVLNKKLAKYQGKEVEDTGLNLFAPTTGLGLIGLIAACIFVPGFLTFVIFLIRRLFATIRVLVTKIQAFEAEEPVAAKKLKDSLSRGMDSQHKDIVRSVKAQLIREGRVNPSFLA
jgi:hypothetical protein